MPHSRGWRDEGRPRGGDPAAVGEVLDGLMTERVLAQGIVVGRLAGEWSNVVGERLAQETAPTRLDAGTLTVTASSGAWGAQVRFLSEDLRKGANRALGSEVVKRVRVVVAEEVHHRPKPL
jgi:predicted nucleic acid-binding Zn ribbon protein